jgi:lysophospholipase L1-like esterase
MGMLVLIVLALYGSLAGLVDSAVSPQPKPAPKVAAPQSESEAPPAATAAGGAPGHLLVVGDSLAEGTEAPLAQLLPGWHIKTSAFTGRSTADGVAQILSMPSLPATIAVSLGTNDNPSETATFAGEVTQVLDAAGPSTCVVWANIARPPYGGVSYSGFNHVLERLSLTHPNLLVVDWARISHSQPGLLGSDGVHATSQGYAVRAQAIASAIASCGGVGTYGTYGGTGAGAVGD